MSAIADITVFDGASTPVSHTLKAISVTRKGAEVIAEYREALADVPVDAQVRVTSSLQKLRSGVYKGTMRIVVPVMESISGQNAAGYTAPPKIAYEDTFIIQGLFHERSTEAGRQLAGQMAINLANNVATTVTPVTAGVFAELFYQLVSPT